MTTLTKPLAVGGCLAVAIAALSSFIPSAQAHEFGTMTWDFTYDGGVGGDWGDAIRFDSQGRLAVAGYTTTLTEAQEALVFQVTPAPGSSTVNWHHTRGVPGGGRHDRFYGMAIDSADNIICTGVLLYAFSPIPDNYAEPITEKFFPDGSTDWQDSWPGVSGGTESWGSDIVINANDEAFAANYYDIGAHNYNVWGVRKYVTTGPGTYLSTLEADYSYDNGAATGSYTYSNRSEGIAVDDAGGVCTVGRVGEGAASRRNWHVRLYGLDDQEPPQPELKWSHTEGASANGLHGVARRVVIDSDGSPVVVGGIMHSAGVYTGRVVKYNKDPETGTTEGEPAWTVEFPAGNVSFYNGVYVDRMGYYWVCGYELDSEDVYHATMQRLDPDDGSILNEISWDGVHIRGFDIRSRRLAVILSDGEDILLEVYTPDPPEITLAGDSVIELEVHSDYTEPGFSAYDEFEREDLTSAVAVTSLPDAHTVGSYSVRYNVDAYNGESAVEKTRTVNIVDTTAPMLTLVGSDEIRVDAGVPYVDPGYSVSDNYDTNYAGNVVVTGNVDIDTPGIYELTYNVSDSNGNPAPPVTRRVRVAQLRIATVTITPSGDIHITAETQVGMDYRISRSTDLATWTALEIVTTPDGLLDWHTAATGAGGRVFFRVERWVDG